jgi:hypothetical protein
MSYDLAVFEPRAELRNPEVFDEWYEKRGEWIEEGIDGYDCGDPAHATQALRDWFAEMILLFPPMNGPLAADIDDDDAVERAADYSIYPDLIYVSFGWSQAEEACEACVRLAEKHGVGFFDITTGGVYFPDATGKLALAHGGSPAPDA